MPLERFCGRTTPCAICRFLQLAGINSPVLRPHIAESPVGFFFLVCGHRWNSAVHNFFHGRRIPSADHIFDTVRNGRAKHVTVGDDGVLRMQGGICMPNMDGLHILHRANLLCSKPVSTPISPKNSLHTTDSPPFSDPTLYRSLVGGLQYLKFTCPDIAFAVNQVSQFMHPPLVAHYTVVKHILRYLNNSLSHGLFISGGSVDHLECYSDANWAGCPSTRCSTSAFCLFLGPNLVSRSSKKQNVVSRSSAEAEYRSVAHVAAEVTWMCSLL
uniref:Uncharacterized mitochondrial protein AtMg00810-like n=1 Tax=Nicotiana tabacum TaxID=4097 RepID=A0A1S4A7F2_TOBAC|nr:PREDICTED: uncharacterized mitochondrial protein AtMg00810-like [Nicotiana tabacum]